MSSSFHTKRDFSRVPTYPYEYSAAIVESFVEKYARATNFCAKKLGMTPRSMKNSLIFLFIKKNGRWNSVRDTIKYVEKHNMYHYLSGYNCEMFVKYLSYVKVMAEDELIKHGFSDK